MTANTSSDQIMQTTTIDDLNQLSAVQAFLVMLRAMSTSDDITISYTLFEKRTIQDIIDVAEGILEHTSLPQNSADEMSPEETSEYLSHLENMRAYTGG